MFVRFRQTASRLQVGLVEPRRIDGKVRQEHVASVGSIACAPMTIADRIEFWRRLRERLAKLANRIGPAQIKILDAINAKIPMVTLDDQRALQRENAEADEKFWMTLQGLNESTAEDQKGLADMASRAAAGAKVAMDAAAKTAVSAKERLERVAKGEDVSGDLGKPRMPEDFEKELLKAGMTAKDLRRCKKVHAISELGAFDELKLETLASIERAENAAVRKVLSKATIQALRDGRVRP